MKDIIDAIIDGLKSLIKELMKIPVVGWAVCIILALLLAVFYFIGNICGRKKERKKNQKTIAKQQKVIEKQDKDIKTIKSRLKPKNRNEK